ncbi:SRPBCC family protein [Tolypothrix sp. VBCCA 56010]|uniref:SRPBCC family protein n=1 Tax=Tolypothrix sp. VBCCA 56010 TaxID=3137731 RepID=UPI003D7EBB3E
MIKLNMEVFYAYPPQRVWQVITNRQALAAWLMENDFQPRIGHKFRFQHSTLPGIDGSIDCEVIELDEPNRLSYTWQDKLMHQPSIVTWTLTPVDGGTRLQLKHQILQHETIKLEQPQHSAETWQSQFTHKSNTVTQTLSIGRYEPLNSVIIDSFFNNGWNYKLKEILPQILKQS